MILKDFLSNFRVKLEINARATIALNFKKCLLLSGKINSN